MPPKPKLKDRLKRRLSAGPSSGVMKGMMTLAFGSSIGRLISFASIPVLTRLYSSADFGTLSVFTSLTQILIPLTTLRYLVALPLPEKDGDAFSLLSLCFAISVGMSCLAAIIFLNFGPDLLAAFGMAEVVPYLWLVPISMFGASMYEALSMWATRKREYKEIARTQVTQSALGESVKIALAFVAPKPLGLLLGQVVAQSSGTLRLVFAFRPSFKSLLQTQSRGNLWSVAKRYREYPYYRLPAQFLLVFSIQSPMLFAAAIFDAHSTGQLGLAMMSLTLPFLLIGQAASRAFYGEIASASPAQMAGIMVAVIKRFALVMLPLSLGLFLLAPWLFPTVFGAAWQLSGEIASILALTLVPQFASAPFLDVFNRTGSQRIFILLHGSRALLVCAVAAAVAQMGGGILTFTWCYSLAMVATYCATTLLILVRLKSAEDTFK